MPEGELAKYLDKLDKNTGCNKPSDYRDKLPEHPMLWSLCQLLHYPGIVKRNVSFPRRYSGFLKHLCETKGRKKDNQYGDQVNSEYMRKRHEKYFKRGQNYYNKLLMQLTGSKVFAKVRAC